jgi:hypothetical protein
MAEGLLTNVSKTFTEDLLGGKHPPEVSKRALPVLESVAALPKKAPGAKREAILSVIEQLLDALDER